MYSMLIDSTLDSFWILAGYLAYGIGFHAVWNFWNWVLTELGVWSDDEQFRWPFPFIDGKRKEDDK